MQTEAETKQPAPCRKGTGQISKPKFINKKNYTGTEFERATKNWAVDWLMERLYDDVDNAETRHASRFWIRSGRRLKHV